MRVADNKRLQALRDSKLLDTEAEAQFDRLTRLASRALNAPVALISLVDEDRQFFKSHHGLDVLGIADNETPLTHSYCKTVVESEGPLVVEASSNDDRVRTNLATTEYNVASYCGVPLTTKGGEILGSMCVLDIRERVWTDGDLAVLRDLADIAMTEIDLRLAYERERNVRADLADIATALQAAMLPPSLPEIDGLDLAAAYIPHGPSNTVGGDFYDVFPTKDDSWVVVVGDVCGKGAKSARTSIMVRDFLRAASMRGEVATSAMRLADKVLREEAQPFVAVSMVEIRAGVGAHKTTLTLAGQPAALIVSKDDVRVFGEYGTVLGGEMNILDQHPTSVDLKPGETLVLFTDGVTDAPGSVIDEHEIAVALKAMQPQGAQASVDAIVAFTKEFQGEMRAIQDDICVVAVAVPDLEKTQPAELV